MVMINFSEKQENLPEQQQGPSVRQQIKNLSNRAKKLFIELKDHVGEHRENETKDQYNKRVETAYLIRYEILVNIRSESNELMEQTISSDEAVQLKTLLKTIEKPIANALAIEACQLVDHLQSSIKANTSHTPDVLLQETKSAVNKAITAPGVSKSALFKLKGKSIVIENPDLEAWTLIQKIHIHIKNTLHHIDKRSLEASLYAMSTQEAWLEEKDRLNELSNIINTSHFTKKLNHLEKQIEKLMKKAALVVAANSPTNEIPTVKRRKSTQTTDTGKSQVTGWRKMIPWLHSSSESLEENPTKKTLEENRNI